jgi:hypothetical protein
MRPPYTRTAGHFDIDMMRRRDLIRCRAGGNAMSNLGRARAAFAAAVIAALASAGGMALEFAGAGATRLLAGWGFLLVVTLVMAFRAFRSMRASRAAPE